MQIVYLGFPGFARIEADAAVQLMRLERFAQALSGCHLAIAKTDAASNPIYDVRLDLVTRNGELISMPPCADAHADAAIRAAFGHAERALVDRLL
ncbi:hypothetical protein LJR230_004441 [Trinickia sp. LjRoot230]|uniref:hypothetical protein n=1 Tax=Trinickia sp. LjRoot230 TaxID=3342288 RepID=UPI003ECCBC6D